MKRRNFIIGSVGLFLLHEKHLFAKSLRANKIPEYGCLVSPYSFKSSGKSKHGALLFDLDLRKTINIDIPFAVHKIVLDPTSNGIGYGVSSYGNEIAKIDLKDGKLLTTGKLEGRFTFSGHSQISKVGSIYATVFDGSRVPPETGLVIINKEKLVLDEELIFPTIPGLGPLHDLQFSFDEKHLITTGGQLIVEYDPQAKIVSKTHRISFDLPNAVLNHFAVSKFGNFGIQSATFDEGRNNEAPARNGAVVLFKNETKKFQILRKRGELAKRLDQDLFGLCLNGDGSILCVAGRWDDHLTFWNMSSGAFMHGLDFSQPTGVTRTSNEKYFVVTTLEGLKYFDTTSTEKVETLESFEKEFVRLFAGKTSKRLFHSTAFTI